MKCLAFIEFVKAMNRYEEKNKQKSVLTDIAILVEMVIVAFNFHRATKIKKWDVVTHLPLYKKIK